MTEAINIGSSRAAKAGTIGILSEIRQLFQEHLDRAWLANLVDEAAMDPSLLRDIRRLCSIREVFPGDERDLREGAQALSLFVREARGRLVPLIRERLGVSGLAPSRLVGDPSQLLLRRLVALAFPVNIERLRVLAERLEASLGSAVSFVA
jgi:hypothetical protein